MRNMAVLRAIVGDTPFVYPIVQPFVARGAEQLCAEVSLFQHTLGGREASLSSHPWLFPG